jgi:hypothetical protein
MALYRRRVTKDARRRERAAELGTEGSPRDPPSAIAPTSLVRWLLTAFELHRSLALFVMAASRSLLPNEFHK